MDVQTLHFFMNELNVEGAKYVNEEGQRIYEVILSINDVEDGVAIVSCELFTDGENGMKISVAVKIVQIRL